MIEGPQLGEVTRLKGVNSHQMYLGRLIVIKNDNRKAELRKSNKSE